MSLDHHTEHAQPGTTAAATPPPQLAAGKRTKTESLPATGVPFVDDGTACERDDTAGRVCFLTEMQRTRLVTGIANRAGAVGANARDALQDSRIDELVSQPGGWSALAEFMFYATTGPIIGTIAASVKASKYASATEDVKALLTNVSRAQRKQLQGMLSVNPGKESRVRFIELVRDSIGPWQKSIYEESPIDLGDDGLTALNDALDPETLTVDFFKAKIADMLSRFDKQQVDQIGVEAIYRHGVPVYIGRGSARRLVMLEDFGLHNLAASGGPKPRDLVQKIGADKKPIVIDKDLEPMAVALYAQRTGKTPMHMDIEAALAIGGAFASNFLDDLLSLGAGS